MRKFLTLGFGALLAVSPVLVPLPASAATTTVVVTNADLVTAPAQPGPGQFAVIDQNGTGQGGAVNVFGPVAPPLGDGSLQMTVTSSADHWSVYTDDWAGTMLSDITALSYSTYTDNTVTDPALQVVIDPGTPSMAGKAAGCTTRGYSTLNFEPYLQVTGAVVANTWQSWNVLAAGGVVWATHLTGMCTPETYATSGGVSWATFVSYYPDAVVLPLSYGGGVGVNVGSGWSAMVGNVDALTVGTASNTTTYNFEPNSGNRPFASTGSGTETNASPSGCQFTVNGCTVVSAGTAISTHLGRGAYTSSLTIDWAKAVPNGSGGYCAPAAGVGSLTAANGDVLTQYERGMVCEVGLTSLTASHTFTGSFTNTGGTGRFANATGGGTISGGDNGEGFSFFRESGDIGY